MDRQRLHVLEARERVRAARFPHVPLDAAAAVVRAETGARVEGGGAYHPYYVNGQAVYASVLQKLARGIVTDPAATAADRHEALEDLRLRATGGAFYGLTEDRLLLLLARNRIRRAQSFGAVDCQDAEQVLRAAGIAEPPSRHGYRDRYSPMDIRRMARKIAAPLATADAAEALAAVRTYLETAAGAPPEAAEEARIHV